MTEALTLQKEPEFLSCVKIALVALHVLMVVSVVDVDVLGYPERHPGR